VSGQAGHGFARGGFGTRRGFDFDVQQVAIGLAKPRQRFKRRQGLARKSVRMPAARVQLRQGMPRQVAADAVAQASGQSPRAVVDALLAAELRAEVVGFMPGFAYLGGLPDLLVIPRRPSPRPSVPAGSVAIAGGQAAVYPSATPGGWNLIGQCPDVLFDPHQQPPVLIALGDRVRFEEISRSEFEARWVQRFR
jgi:hypothetical protein